MNDFLSQWLPTMIAMVLTGAFAGILAGLLGVGGGFVLLQLEADGVTLAAAGLLHDLDPPFRVFAGDPLDLGPGVIAGMALDEDQLGASAHFRGAGDGGRDVARRTVQAAQAPADFHQQRVARPGVIAQLLSGGLQLPQRGVGVALVRVHVGQVHQVGDHANAVAVVQGQ